MTVRQAIADALQGVDGRYTGKRTTYMLVCVVVLGTLVAACFMEWRFVPNSGEMVTLIAVRQGAKAAQLRFELGKQGLVGFTCNDETPEDEQ